MALPRCRRERNTPGIGCRGRISQGCMRTCVVHLVYIGSASEAGRSASVASLYRHCAHFFSASALWIIMMHSLAMHHSQPRARRWQCVFQCGRGMQGGIQGVVPSPVLRRLDFLTGEMVARLSDTYASSPLPALFRDHVAVFRALRALDDTQCGRGA